MTPSIGTALVVAGGWLFSLCLHEFGHAAVAYVGGDTSVKEKGYLTFNPLKYTDPGLSLVVPLLILMIGGIALPGAAVYIDRRKLRNRLWHSLVSLAGPAANVVCMLAIAQTFKTLQPEINWFWASMALLAYLQTIAVILNLIPVPGLDGFGVIEPWLPAPVRVSAYKIGRYGIWLVFLALWFLAPLNRALWNTALGIDFNLDIPIDYIPVAFETFRRQSAILMVGAIVLLIVFRVFKKKTK